MVLDSVYALDWRSTRCKKAAATVCAIETALLQDDLQVWLAFGQQRPSANGIRYFGSRRRGTLGLKNARHTSAGSARPVNTPIEGSLNWTWRKRPIRSAPIARQITNAAPSNAATIFAPVSVHRSLTTKWRLALYVSQFQLELALYLANFQLRSDKKIGVAIDCSRAFALT